MDHNKLYPFLKAARGNWHNALFLSCKDNTCQCSCREGFLLIADAEGLPLLMPLKCFRELTGESVEPAECSGTLSTRAFRSVYSVYLEWHTASDRECPICQLIRDNAQECVIPP